MFAKFLQKSQIYKEITHCKTQEGKARLSTSEVHECIQKLIHIFCKEKLRDTEIRFSSLVELREFSRFITKGVSVGWVLPAPIRHL